MPTSGSRMSLPTVVDTDIELWNDDAIALLVAHRAGLNVVGVNVVAGNPSVEDSFDSARRMLGMLGLDHVPVGLGAACPLRHRRGRFEDAA